jgi:hypothetical protein
MFSLETSEIEIHEIEIQRKRTQHGRICASSVLQPTQPWGGFVYSTEEKAIQALQA